MKEIIKLSSVCIFVDSLFVYPCDDQGNPDFANKKSYDDLSPEWFQNISHDDKELINSLKNS
jgi:hypothetical protein